MNIVPIWLKLALLAGAIIGILVAAMHFGARNVRNEVQLRDARAGVAVGRVNTETQAGVAEASDRHGRRTIELQTESQHARDAITAAPGADQPVPRELVRGAVCSVERLRGIAESHCS